MPTLTDLHTEISALPPNLRSEVLDFVQFVKQRHGLPTAPPADVSVSGTGDSPLFRALEAIGFVGGIESDEQLSTCYKQKLDFSGKCGSPA